MNEAETGGYEGGRDPLSNYGESREIGETPVWKVQKATRFYSGNIVAQVFVDGLPVGVVSLVSEEDFLDLKMRLEAKP